MKKLTITIDRNKVTIRYGRRAQMRRMTPQEARLFLVMAETLFDRR
jgi:hypothetical protein